MGKLVIRLVWDQKYRPFESDHPDILLIINYLQFRDVPKMAIWACSGDKCSRVRIAVSRPSGGLAQLARASALQAECEGFDSPNFHIIRGMGLLG